MADRLVKEEIDTRILNLLGIDDVFDIDYTTYLLLLREAIVKGSFGKSKLSDEELALLSNERKRVKNKQDNGRFEIKSKKISASKFTSGKFVSKPKVGGSIVKFQKPKEKGPLSFIGDILGSIFKTITEKNKLDKKNAEQQRKEEEREKRRKGESLLEKTGKGIKEVKNLVQKAVSPFKNIIDKIINFLVFTFLGKAFNDFLNWLSDSENKKKLDSVIRFLVSHWPLILGGFVLFGTSFGRFIRGTLKLVARSIFLLGAQIPKLRNFLRKNKGLAFLGMAAAPLVSREAINILNEKPNDAAGLESVDTTQTGETDLQNAKEPTDQITKLNIPKFMSGGIVFPNINLKLSQSPTNIKDIQMNKGGAIDKQTGMNITGAGPDTQLIAAQPGEIVMSKKAVDTYGPQFFLGLNKAAGATNVPKYTNNIQLATNGGVVGMQGDGFLNQLGRFLPGTGTVMAPKSDGPVDLQGIRQTMAGYQNKLLGMPLGETYFPRGNAGQYSQQENRRYYEKTGKYFVPTQYPGGASGIHGLYTPQQRQQTTPRTSSTNQRLNTSIQNARDITRLPGGAAYSPLIESVSSTAIKQQAYYDMLKNTMRKAGMRGAEESMNIYGKPIKRQGGGLIPQGPFTPLPSAGYVRPQGSFIPKPILALPGPMPGTTLPFGYDPMRGLRGGGLVRENSGMNILGGTADRQLTMLQPGEYVLPAGTVSKLGVSLIDKIVAMTDSDSNAAKLGRSKINRSIPGPPVKGSSGMMPITLPPITGGADPQMSNNASGTSVPQIDAIAPTSMEVRESLAAIYGIL